MGKIKQFFFGKPKISYEGLLSASEKAYRGVKDDINNYQREARRLEEYSKELGKQKEIKYKEMEKSAKENKKVQARAIMASMIVTDQKQSQYEAKREKLYCMIEKLKPLEFELRTTRSSLRRKVEEKKIYGNDKNEKMSMNYIVRLLKSAEEKCSTSWTDLGPIDNYFEDQHERTTEQLNEVYPYDTDFDTLMEQLGNKEGELEPTMKRAYDLGKKLQEEETSSEKGTYTLKRAQE